jgi:cytochrome P450
MSFSPFLGGKRICVGKTFAETSFRTVLPVIMNSFDFDFEDVKIKENKPKFNSTSETKPVI